MNKPVVVSGTPKKKIEIRISELIEQINKLKNEKSYKVNPMVIESYENTLKVNFEMLKIITGN